MNKCLWIAAVHLKIPDDVTVPTTCNQLGEFCPLLGQPTCPGRHLPHENYVERNPQNQSCAVTTTRTVNHSKFQQARLHFRLHQQCKMYGILSTFACIFKTLQHASERRSKRNVMFVTSMVMQQSLRCGPV